jgi:hypothetical protein
MQGVGALLFVVGFVMVVFRLFPYSRLIGGIIVVLGLAFFQTGRDEEHAA